MKEFVRIGDKIQGSWTHGKENNTCIMHKNYFATFLCTIHCNSKSWVFRGAAYHDHLAFHIQRKVPLRCNHATMNIEETFAGTPPVMRKEKGRGNFYHPQIKAI